MSSGRSAGKSQGYFTRGSLKSLRTPRAVFPMVWSANISRLWTWSRQLYGQTDKRELFPVDDHLCGSAACPLWRKATAFHRIWPCADLVFGAAAWRALHSRAATGGVQPRIVSEWRPRFADHGLAGLKDRPRAGKQPIYGKATNKRILALLDKPPPGYARSTVRCWRRHWKTLMFNISGASCVSTTSILPPANRGARATTPSSWRRLPM